MHKHYDFSNGVRGVHVARYREGVQIVVTDSKAESASDDSSILETEIDRKIIAKQESLTPAVRSKNS